MSAKRGPRSRPKSIKLGSGAISYQDIAREAGVSRNTVSLALRNSRRIKAQTRRRIRQIAERLGYTGDPKLAEYMRYVRARRQAKYQPILALLNAHDQPVASLASVNIRGIARSATEAARRYGYRLEEFWLKAPEMNDVRASAILRARGIEGVVVLPLPAGCEDISLDWSSFISVSTCYSAYRLGLNLVTTNRQHYLELALERLRRMGYGRIGLAIDEDTDKRSHHQTLAHFYWDQSLRPASERVRALYRPTIGLEDLRAWINAERPEAVISTRNHIYELIRTLGMSVPHDIGFASLAASARDIPSLAGIDERPDAVGASAIDLLVTQIQHADFGLPRTRRILLVEGDWISGRTVSSRRSKRGNRS